jgi:hypothetical protein
MILGLTCRINALARPVIANLQSFGSCTATTNVEFGNAISISGTAKVRNEATKK